MTKKAGRPLSDNFGQVEHQTVHTEEGVVLDLDEYMPDVVEQDGQEVISDDEVKVKEYIKNGLSIDNLIETFTDNAHETLLKLLSLQNNQRPLKRGGIGISYRTDALIMNCKMEFSSDENLVFDAILGTVSSYPDYTCYRIEPQSFLPFSKYKDPKYLYKAFKQGANKLKDRTLLFEGVGPDGEESISLPWFNILRYHRGRGKSEDNAYIEFVPSDFFKDLCLCSKLIHGAYGSFEVTTQLQGKYTTALYWFLENKKKYKEYPGATPGVFKISMEDFRHQFTVPKSYSPADIKRRVLDSSKECINQVEECDFTFDYIALKNNAGYQFNIFPKSYIKSDKTIGIECKIADDFYDQVRTLILATDMGFSEDDVEDIYWEAKKYERSVMEMMNLVVALKKRADDRRLDPVNDKLVYLKKMIQQGTRNTTSTNKKGFNNFTQNDYDFEELEEKLLDN